MPKLFNPKFTVTASIKFALEEIEKRKVTVCDESMMSDLYLYKKSSQEILAYFDARQLVDELKDKTISKELLQTINKIVVSAEPQEPSSDYQIFSGQVFDLDGQFVYYSASNSRLEIHKLLNWLNEASSSDILRAAIIHYKFLKIHPFIGGNGRTARLLTRLMLLKSGYNPNFCNHFEDYLEKNKAEYYKSLDFRKQGEKFEVYDFNDTNDITSWIEFFCKSLIRAGVLCDNYSVWLTTIILAGPN
jgi:Fic family protein